MFVFSFVSDYVSALCVEDKVGNHVHVLFDVIGIKPSLVSVLMSPSEVSFLGFTRWDAYGWTPVVV